MRTRAVLWIAAALCLAAGPTTQPSTVPPSTDQRIDQLLTPAGPPAGQSLPLPGGRTTDATSGHAAVAPGAAALHLLREGTPITDQTGRLNHTPDGQQCVFTFDADGKTMRDPPMILLPNLKLTAMEGLQSGMTRDVKFRVSGTVTEYKSRNYLLLTKVVVVQDYDGEF